MNAIKEIQEKLKAVGKSEKDILWIGSKDGVLAMDWDKFKSKFASVHYDNGFGTPEIATDLVVVLNDKSWLEREEYDGAESWSFKQLPVLKKKQDYNYIDCGSRNSIGCETLQELNEDNEDE